MKRPSFQFYPADWRNNAKLRRCAEAARGAWMDVLCVLHDSDEYGVCRWPLADIARAAGVPLKLLKELAEKGVLKGADKGAAPYVYTPRHAGKAGDPVTLVEAGEGPCWYCSRFVRDEWVRQRRGQGTRFSDTNQPTKGGTDDDHNQASKVEPKPAPKGGFGERQGDGPTSPSTSKTTTEEPGGSSDAEASKVALPVEGLTAGAALFQVAVPWLVSRGMKDASARSLLGAAKKQLGDEGAWDLASDCMRDEVMDPAPWLAAALNDRIARGGYNRRPGTGMPPAGMNRQEALEAKNQEVAQRLARTVQ